MRKRNKLNFIKMVCLTVCVSALLSLTATGIKIAVEYYLPTEESVTIGGNAGERDNVPVTDIPAVSVPVSPPTPQPEPETSPVVSTSEYEDAGAEIDTSALSGYQTKYKGLYAVKKEEIPLETKTMFLTFDDGPSGVTKQVLDELDAAGVKATFFVTPGTVSRESADEIMRDIVERGHKIGIHTSSHDYKKIYQSVDAFVSDMNDINQIVYNATGVRCEIYRFPGGSLNAYNKSVASEIATEMSRRGFSAYDWNVSLKDAEGKKYTSDELFANAKESMQGQKKLIVLAHDAGAQKQTSGAISKIVNYAKEQGYVFDVLTNAHKELTFIKK